MKQQLEQMLTYAPLEQKNKNKTIDIYATNTAVVYSAPIMIYDFPSVGTQLHIHGSPDGNTLYNGGFKKYGEDKIFMPLDPYNLAMADHDLRNSGMTPLLRGIDYK